MHDRLDPIIIIDQLYKQFLFKWHIDTNLNQVERRAWNPFSNATNSNSVIMLPFGPGPIRFISPLRSSVVHFCATSLIISGVWNPKSKNLAKRWSRGGEQLWRKLCMWEMEWGPEVVLEGVLEAWSCVLWPSPTEGHDGLLIPSMPLPTSSILRPEFVPLPWNGVKVSCEGWDLCVLAELQGWFFASDDVARLVVTVCPP